jgi:GntR family transcriptional regulator, transcriptional repressor for pyruvate dehydrogenase complex
MISKEMKLRRKSAVRSVDVTEKLIDTFKRLIADGTFKPGGRLPPERELADNLGVNRSSLRQALKVLQIMGVLFQRVGDGTYLNRNEAEILSQPLAFLRLMGDITDEELFEARLIVETELAARAADRAAGEHLAALRRAIADLEASRTDQERLDADLAFHETIFRASGNRLCHLIFRVIARNILESMARIAPRMNVTRPLSFHKAIYSAILERNPEKARERMAEHLLDAKAMLLSSNLAAPAAKRRAVRRAASPSPKLPPES